MKFDVAWLESFDDKIVIDTIGSKISPLVVNPGKIVLSTQNLYFQPFNNIEPVSFNGMEMMYFDSRCDIDLCLFCRSNNTSKYVYLILNPSSEEGSFYSMWYVSYD